MPRTGAGVSKEDVIAIWGSGKVGLCILEAVLNSDGTKGIYGGYFG